jgi:hypothetical protein
VGGRHVLAAFDQTTNLKEARLGRCCAVTNGRHQQPQGSVIGVGVRIVNACYGNVIPLHRNEPLAERSLVDALMSEVSLRHGRTGPVVRRGSSVTVSAAELRGWPCPRRTETGRWMYRGNSLRVRAELPSDLVTQVVDSPEAARPPLRVVYGYIRVATDNAAQTTILKAELRVFCRSNDLALSTVFVDRDTDDRSTVRPAFASLLDVCQGIGPCGVVVPNRLHLSPHKPTLEVLVGQIVTTGASLTAADEVAAAGPSGRGPAAGIEAAARGEER